MYHNRHHGNVSCHQFPYYRDTRGHPLREVFEQSTTPYGKQQVRYRERRARRERRNAMPGVSGDVRNEQRASNKNKPDITGGVIMTDPACERERTVRYDTHKQFMFACEFNATSGAA